MTIQENIIQEYVDYIKSHGEKPSIAYVNVLWLDLSESEMQTIVLNDSCNNTFNDDDVLYYVSDIDNLLNCCDWDTTGGDFIITKLIGFENC